MVDTEKLLDFSDRLDELLTEIDQAGYAVVFLNVNQDLTVTRVDTRDLMFNFDIEKKWSN